MANINDYKFKALHKLKSKITSNVKLVFVFGDNGNDIIIVSKDDKVFAFGDNTNGCLGLGLTGLILEPTPLTELNDKQIIDISSGSSFMIGLTKSGQLYSWGLNNYGQLGNRAKNNVYYKPEHVSMNEEIVVQISCGSNHSLVLTKTGEVFAFGLNLNGECSNSTNTTQIAPRKVSGLNDEKVISISCGGQHSLALTENGKVFSWGLNNYGQLGIGNNTNRAFVNRIISLDNILIKRISGGLYHSILLSTDGDIYTFGYNNCGQLGNGSISNQNIPVKIVKSVKFIDIASDALSSISMALSQNNSYVWGDCDNEVITSPMSTCFQSFNDIFATYAKRKITHKPIQFNQNKPTKRLMKCLSQAFNNPEKSDIKIKIGDHYIYAHRWFLENSCEHFKLLFSKGWSESKTDEIEITDFPYNVYFAFIKYLYTDCIELEEIEELIDLLDLANGYFEDELKVKCVQIIENCITVENVCTLYSAAVKYNCPELEDLCFEFSINKLDKIRKTEAFKEMNGEYCKHLFDKFMERESFRRSE